MRGDQPVRRAASLTVIASMARNLNTSVSGIAGGDDAVALDDPEDAVPSQGGLDGRTRRLEIVAAIRLARADVGENWFHFGDVEVVLEPVHADVGEERRQLLYPGLEAELVSVVAELPLGRELLQFAHVPVTVRR